MRKSVIVVVTFCALGIGLVFVSLAAMWHDLNHAEYYKKKVAELEATDHLTKAAPSENESPLTKSTPRPPTKGPSVHLTTEQLVKYCSDRSVRKSDPDCNSVNLCRQARLSARNKLFGPTTYESRVIKACAVLGF